MAASALATVEAEASPGSAPTAIAALGDSFISGEGGRWMGNGTESWATRSGTDRAAACDAWGYCEYEPERVYGSSERNRCHRSDVAPIRSAPVAVDRRVNLACSGARAENLWPVAMGGRAHFGEPPQADALAALAAEAEVRMVVVTVGANDAGFGDLVAECALDWARSAERAPSLCAPSSRAALEAALPAVERRVRRVLGGVRRAMTGAGYARAAYRLVAMGYASPLPPGRWIRYPESGWSRLDAGCPFWDADADWAAGEATDSIDSAIRRAARSAGAEYLDVRHALDGHQLCDRRSDQVGSGGPTPDGAEWVRRLELGEGSPRESLHPNAYGQRALGACIGLLYASPVGDYACRLEAGRTYVDGMAIGPLR
ncbi:MAG: GDSL-type esterase/lipase family protein [Chloroflexota bacterium]